MNEQALIKIAQAEITLNKQDEELWKKCLTLTGNDILKAKDKYTRQRVIQLKKLDSITLILLDQSLQTNAKDSQTQYSIPPEKKITNSKTLPNPEPIVSEIETLKKELEQNEDINTTEDNADEKKWLGIPKIWFVSIITILILGWILSNSNSNTENKNNAKYKNQSTTVQTNNPSTNVSSGNIQTDTITEADCRIISGIIRHSILHGGNICEVQDRIYYISEKKTNIDTERRTKQSNISVNSNSTTQPQYSLAIKPNPVDATIKILNIGPKYYDGIFLSKGKYNIEVSKNGYETVSQWIDIEKNENIQITLQKKITLSQYELDILAGKTPQTQNKQELSKQEECILKGGDWKRNSSTNSYYCSKSDNSNIQSSYSTSKGLELYKSKCFACHGDKASKSALNVSKIITGWSTSRIISAVNGYKNGEGGPMKGVMKPIVSGLGDDDLKAVAETISSF